MPGPATPAGRPSADRAGHSSTCASTRRAGPRSPVRRASCRSSTAVHAAGAGRTAISASRCSRQTGAEATASAQAGSAVSFTTLSARPASVLRRPLARGTVRRSRGLGHAPGAAPPTGVMDRLELAQSRNERRTEEDRRAEAARAAPIGVKDRRCVAAAEPACRVEPLAEPDVVDALGEDRLEPRRLGAFPFPAQRTARRRRTHRRGGRRRSSGPAGPSSAGRDVGRGHRHGPMVAHVGLVCSAWWGDDGTGWVRDLLVMFEGRLGPTLVPCTDSPSPSSRSSCSASRRPVPVAPPRRRPRS